MSAEQFPTDAIVESAESGLPQSDVSQAENRTEFQIATRRVLQPLLLDQSAVEKPLQRQEQTAQPTQNYEAVTGEKPRHQRMFDYAASKAGHAIIFSGGFRRRRG